MVVDLFAIAPPLHYPKVPCRACTAFFNTDSKLKQHWLFVLDKSEYIGFPLPCPQVRLIPPTRLFSDTVPHDF